jgi:hypothetical protein
MLEEPLDAFVWRNVFSEGECELLGKMLESLDLRYEFWNPAEPGKRELRSADTIEVRMLDYQLSEHLGFVLLLPIS